MKETFRIADEVSKTMGGDGFNNYRVRARLAIMEKRFKEAESIYLEQVRVQLYMSHVCHHRFFLLKKLGDIFNFNSNVSTL